jgi:hypothetical protein
MFGQLQRRQEDDECEIRHLQAQLETERKQYETEVCDICKNTRVHSHFKSIHVLDILVAFVITEHCSVAFNTKPLPCRIQFKLTLHF